MTENNRPHGFSVAKVPCNHQSKCSISKISFFYQLDEIKRRKYNNWSSYSYARFISPRYVVAVGSSWQTLREVARRRRSGSIFFNPSENEAACEMTFRSLDFLPNFVFARWFLFPWCSFAKKIVIIWLSLFAWSVVDQSVRQFVYICANVCSFFVVVFLFIPRCPSWRPWVPWGGWRRSGRRRSWTRWRPRWPPARWTCLPRSSESAWTWNTLKTDLSGLRWYSFYLTLGIGWRSIKSCCVRLQGHRELRYYCPLNYYWRRNISSLILISISALRINSRLNHNQFLNVDLIKINRALTSRRRSCRWPRRHRRTWGSHRRHRYLQDTTIVI